MITNLFLIILFIIVFIIVAKIDDIKPDKSNANIGLLIILCVAILVTNLILTFITENL